MPVAERWGRECRGQERVGRHNHSDIPASRRRCPAPSAPYEDDSPRDARRLDDAARLASRRPGEARWDAIAADCADWARQASVAWRDAVVLVPFVELLAPARRAFARLGTWMPRIETTRTLAASLGPPTAADGESSFDAALDTLVATQLLARERWGAEWMRRDRRGFEHAAARVATTARELARAASSLAPSARAAWWQAARDALDGGVGGPAGLEKQLARIAVEWAANAPEAASTDRLFDASPLGLDRDPGRRRRSRSPLALLAQGDAPALVVDTDVPLDQPFAAIAHELAAEPPAHALCDGFEDEAWAAAAQVLDHLGRGERPVALVALDRVLVRRVRALLERAGVRIADETGWKMSTTRAGASVMSLLQAARPIASADAYLDWLKSLAADGDARGGLARRARSGLPAPARLAPRRDRRRLAAGRRGASPRRSDGHARRDRGDIATPPAGVARCRARRARALGRARAAARRRCRPPGARRARPRPAARAGASRVARRRRRAADAGRVHALGRRRARARRLPPADRRGRG